MKINITRKKKNKKNEYGKTLVTQIVPQVFLPLRDLKRRDGEEGGGGVVNGRTQNRCTPLGAVSEDGTCVSKGKCVLSIYLFLV